jgi:hypothetical protein
LHQQKGDNIVSANLKSPPPPRGVGSIKDSKGALLDPKGHFWILKRAPKKFFPEMLATGKKNFLILYRNICMFFTKLFLKTLKFPNKKGTFDVNLVFTATLACTEKGTFHHKKGHFWSFEKIEGRGGHVPPLPPSQFLRH